MCMFARTYMCACVHTICISREHSQLSFLGAIYLIFWDRYPFSLKLSSEARLVCQGASGILLFLPLQYWDPKHTHTPQAWSGVLLFLPQKSILRYWTQVLVLASQALYWDILLIPKALALIYPVQCWWKWWVSLMGRCKGHSVPSP